MMNNFNNFIYNNNNTVFDYNECTLDECHDSEHICSIMKDIRPICDKLKKRVMS